MGISEPWSPPRLKGVTGPGSPRCWSRIPKENPLNHPIKLKDSTSAAEITKRWYPKWMVYDGEQKTLKWMIWVVPPCSETRVYPGVNMPIDVENALLSHSDHDLRTVGRPSLC